MLKEGGGGRRKRRNMQHPRTLPPGPDAARMAKPFSQPHSLCAAIGTCTALGCSCFIHQQLRQPAAMPASLLCRGRNRRPRPLPIHAANCVASATLV